MVITTNKEKLDLFLEKHGCPKPGSKKTKRKSTISLETLQMQNQMKEVEIGLSQLGAKTILPKLNMLMIFQLLIVQFTMMTSVLNLSQFHTQDKPAGIPISELMTATVLLSLANYMSLLGALKTLVDLMIQTLSIQE